MEVLRIPSSTQHVFILLPGRLLRQLLPLSFSGSRIYDDCLTIGFLFGNDRCFRVYVVGV